MFEGKRGKRKYLIIEKRKSEEEARYFARTYWKCKDSDLIVGGADRKKDDEFYVELPRFEGKYWCLWRGRR